MDKKSVWKAIGTIKDPVVRAYLEDAVQGHAEVERLTAENKKSIQGNLLSKLENRDQQIATLKTALKMACTDLADRDYPPSNAEQGTKENINFYIHQAQQLMYEAHGEAEK